ncbi:S-layer homology domain-containing protein [Sedimentibacter sp. LTW-03]|uniref:S-layer homology domain-containing protein n=1 Tax=Sedimentibacter sp. LTW-03 TaxID=3453406 RepID=UPI003F85EB52
MKKIITILTVILVLFSFSVCYASQKSFTDVKETDWYYNTLASIVEKEIIDGYPDGTFKPQNNITKAEFTKVIIAALKIEIVEGNPFVDVNEHWAKNIVNTAVENQIIDRLEYGDTFNPDKNITRIEMAKMVVKALGMDAEAKNKAGEMTLFSDDSAISDEDKGYVVIAAENEVIRGYEDMTFRPEGQATRAEASQMLINMLMVIESQEEEPDNVVDRVNEALQDRDFEVKLPKGMESAAKHEDPETYEELIENIETLKVYPYTTKKSDNWELISLSQFVSNPNEDQATVNVIGVIKMKLPNYKLDIVDFNFGEVTYNCIYSDELTSDGFSTGVLIKDGEIIERVSHVRDHYTVGLKEKESIYKADYIAFTRHTGDFFSNKNRYDSKIQDVLVVFENPFKK